MTHPKIQAWSNSRLNVYESCPFKAKLLYIDKFKEPGSEAMDRGKDIHVIIDTWLKGPMETQVPQCALKLMADMEEVKAARPYTELQVAFNSEWGPVDWFAKDAWARIVIDALILKDVTARVIDWKTGKMRGDYDAQLELYALTVLLMFPKVTSVTSAFYFLDAGRIIEGETYGRSDIDFLKAKWTDRVHAMLNDVDYHPTPNQWCGYCHFSRLKGGPCVAA